MGKSLSRLTCFGEFGSRVVFYVLDKIALACGFILLCWAVVCSFAGEFVFPARKYQAVLFV